MHLSVILESARARFLLLTPICVFLGASIASHNGAIINYPMLIITFIGALLAHISVHLLNEYSDFKSGLDLQTQKTPFSGGSGALPKSPQALQSVLVAGLISLLATILIGLYLMAKIGLGLLPFGLLGVLIIVTYTDWLNKSPLLCLIAPGLGFGLLMVLGTQYVLEQQFYEWGLLVALVPFFLYNNLLLLNQYPDIHPDRASGRRHLTIAYGIEAGHFAYGLNLIAIVTLIVVGVFTGLLPTLSLITLISLPLALIALKGAIKYGEAMGEHPQYLASNVIMSLVTPILLGISLLIT